MPLDPSIAMSVKPFQLDDPIAKQQQAQTMRMNAMQLAQAERQEQQQMTLADLYKNNVGPDGKVNTKGMMQGMAQRGLGSQIPGYQKAQAEALKAQAELGKTGTETDAMKFKLEKDRLSATNGMLASLLSRPNVTHDDVINGIQGIVAQGLATPEQGAQVIRMLPGRPEDLRSFLYERGMQGMEEAKRMEMLTPKFEKMDMGGAVQPGTVNQMTGQFSPQGKAMPKVVSPDAVLSANTSRANNRDSIAASKENTQAGITAQEAAFKRQQGKPMPSSALKMQQAELDAIGIASGTQADLTALEKQIADGKLNFGPVRNLVNRGLNMAGASNEESRNMASFKSSLEKLRNDSLRLNTGVQTDGDAQRAWNELFENINDLGVVKQRLSEIKRLNERAVKLRKMNIDNIRSNYGKDPADTSGYEEQEAALGAPDATPDAIKAILKKHGGKP